MLLKPGHHLIYTIHEQINLRMDQKRVSKRLINVSSDGIICKEHCPTTKRSSKKHFFHLISDEQISQTTWCESIIVVVSWMSPVDHPQWGWKSVVSCFPHVEMINDWWDFLVSLVTQNNSTLTVIVFVECKTRTEPLHRVPRQWQRRKYSQTSDGWPDDKCPFSYDSASKTTPVRCEKLSNREMQHVVECFTCAWTFFNDGKEDFARTLC